MQQNDKTTFPRDISEREKKWLFAALPENKIGYKQYRDIIENLVIIGYGRFGEGNFFLGEESNLVDLDTEPSPIFAIANITFEEAKIYVTIHEENEGQIEIDIKSISSEKIPDNLHLTKMWTYSAWIPGQKVPGDNSDVREIHLIINNIVLAIAPKHQKIWVYNSRSGINHLIPVTNYYNELMMILNNKDEEIALNPGRLFTHLDEFTDEQLIQGFLTYNKYWKRIELDNHLFEKKEDGKKKSFFSFFNK